MWIITVYGWESRAATRLVIGCEPIAETTQLCAIALGYKTVRTWGEVAPDRSDEETARAARLMEALAPLVFEEAGPS